jgi:hypothetical protein
VVLRRSDSEEIGKESKESKGGDKGCVLVKEAEEKVGRNGD